MAYYRLLSRPESSAAARHADSINRSVSPRAHSARKPARAEEPGLHREARPAELAASRVQYIYSVSTTPSRVFAGILILRSLRTRDATRYIEHDFPLPVDHFASLSGVYTCARAARFSSLHLFPSRYELSVSTGVRFYPPILTSDPRIFILISSPYTPPNR